MFGRKSHLDLRVHNGKVKAKEVNSGNSTQKECSDLLPSRTMMGNFDAVESCFRTILQELAPRGLLRPSPIVYIQLLDQVEGGVADIEFKAFKEAALGAGAAEVYVIAGKTALSGQELMDNRFSHSSRG